MHDRRRALLLLIGSPGGCAESMMVAHGFKPELLAELIRDGLAAAHIENTHAGKRPIMKITEVGRETLM